MRYSRRNVTIWSIKVGYPAGVGNIIHADSRVLHHVQHFHYVQLHHFGLDICAKYCLFHLVYYTLRLLQQCWMLLSFVNPSFHSALLSSFLLHLQTSPPCASLHPGESILTLYFMLKNHGSGGNKTVLVDSKSGSDFFGCEAVAGLDCKVTSTALKLPLWNILGSLSV